MTNQAFSGLGASVICGTTIYGEVLNVPEVMATLNKIDTTTHNNVSAVKTSRPGFIENGEISIDMLYYAGTEQDAIMTMFYAKTVSVWTIVSPMKLGRAWSFSGYVSGCSTPRFEKDGNCQITVKIQPTGVITPLTTAITGVTDIDVTDQGTTALTLSPTFAATTYGYQVTTDLADTGVKVTLTYAGSGEAAYVANAALATATPSSAITLGTSAGDVIMVPVVVFKTACVPKITWIEVTHGYV
jgi:hypothetical protein